MCGEMAAMWSHVREDDSVRAVVVTGAGDLPGHGLHQLVDLGVGELPPAPGACPAGGVHEVAGPAHLVHPGAAVVDHHVREVEPALVRDQSHQVAFDPVRILLGAEADPVREPFHMRVDGDPLHDAERVAELAGAVAARLAHALIGASGVGHRTAAVALGIGVVVAAASGSERQRQERDQRPTARSVDRSHHTRAARHLATGRRP